MNAPQSMTADAALREAYQDWRRLAELEGEAIRARDWLLMSDCQNRLAALQPRILRLTTLARQEWQQAGLDRSGKEAEMRKIISGLIELEMKNSVSLAAAKEIAREKKDQFDLARQNLRRVERSYASAYQPIWNSFS